MDCCLTASHWIPAEVIFTSRGEEKKRVEQINLQDHLRYQKEPLLLTSLKCFCLFSLGVPLFFIFQTFLQIGRTLILPLKTLSLSLFFKELWHLVKLPFYFIGLQFSALTGVFFPLQGRALFGKIEAKIHRATRREGQPYFTSCFLLGKTILQMLFSKKVEEPLFIGYCMQPIGSLKDPHIVGWKRA